MKILLLNPPILNLDPVKASLFFNSPPLGILYIAAVLEQNNIDVKVIDAAVDGLTIPSLLQKIEQNAFDIIGITSTTFSFYSSVELAKKIKLLNNDIKIIIGGPHISAVPEDVMKNDCFDFGVIGEGEFSFLELIKNINENDDILKNIKGIIYREKDGTIVKTEKRPLIENLDVLPFPARHLVDMTKYKPQPNDNRATPKISMITSRGCPYLCIFCGKSVFGATYRSFSPKYIVSEIKHVIDKYKAKDIAFIDSLFTVSQERVENICNEILKNKIKVTWTCTVRANVIKDKKIFKLMKKAGCWRVRIGIESGDVNISKLINKNLDFNHLFNVVSWADEVGLQPKGFFMIGHFTETEETIKKSIELAKKLPLKDITLQVNTPLPQTFQFNNYNKYGKLIVDDLQEYSLFQPVFVPNGLTKEKMDYWFNKFYRDFYLRPVVFWRHLKYIRSFRDIIKYLKALKLVMFLFFKNNGYRNE